MLCHGSSTSLCLLAVVALFSGFSIVLQVSPTGQYLPRLNPTVLILPQRLDNLLDGVSVLPARHVSAGPPSNHQPSSDPTQGRGKHGCRWWRVGAFSANTNIRYDIRKGCGSGAGSSGECNIAGLIEGYYGGEVCCMLNAALFSSADISIFLSLLIRT